MLAHNSKFPVAKCPENWLGSKKATCACECLSKLDLKIGRKHNEKPVLVGSKFTASFMMITVYKGINKIYIIV